MTQTIDALAVSQDIIGSYRRYLETTFGFQNPERHAELSAALSADRALVNGPILQATAPYATGASLGELIDQGVVTEQFRRFTPEDFPLDRPLYKHQEEAIRKLIDGRNLMVATGTGSGKTECFLLPVINDLLGELGSGTLNNPGVRSLLLYPMNALANDQLKRLRELLKPFPEISFGRYVGDTKHKQRDAVAHHQAVFGEEPLPNELVSRDQMKERPPHILITNFAMLEYLLLRPADTAFFDGLTGKYWRSVVLDEIHVYDGAKGAELGMLLRRLRGRVLGGQRGRLQVVGTSATLGQGPEARLQLAEFGRRLFDEPFAPSEDDPSGLDVVEPVRKELSGSERWRMPQELIGELASAWRSGAEPARLASVVSDSSPPVSVEPDDTVATYLHRLLESEHHVVRLQGVLERGSGPLRDLASEVFTGPSPGQVAVDLVELCLAARAAPQDPPLLPARYHLMVRALEGAFVCRASDHPLGVPRMVLTRQVKCQGCARVGRDRTMFEVSSCRKCGAEYLLGHLDDTNHFQLLTLTSRPLYLHVAQAGDDVVLDEDEAANYEADGPDHLTFDQLCVSCGHLGETGGCGCSRPDPQSVTRLEPANSEGDLRVCVACGGRSNTSIVLRVLTGSEAPVAVVATHLYQALPPGTSEASFHIGAGRKLLSFADSVQDAAFFAPYLSRTYGRAVQRRLIWEVLDKDDDPVPLISRSTRLRRRAEGELVLDDSGSADNRPEVLHWLTAEALAVDRRQSLDGVGLAEITVNMPTRLVIPPILARLGLTDDETKDLARVLLDSLRLSGAMSVPEDVDLADPIFSPRNIVTKVRQQGTEYGILSWSPVRGTNRRLDYLSKVLAALGAAEDPRQLLDALWSNWFAVSGGDWSDVLVSINDRRHGTLYVINHDAVTVQAANVEHRPFRCSSCQQIWWRSVRGVCPTFRCQGTLGIAVFGDEDHYRHLYTKIHPIGMQAAEHTGQLETQYAATLQQEFIDGKVNVLSCSTTFELGVDVGEVQAVLMRNMPPSPANYVQRAGRAGRRAGSAALIVTFAQRRNHDLHYFAHPGDMVDGIVAPPIIEVRNPDIARRHVHAVAFAAYLRHLVDTGEEPAETVEKFFLPEGTSQSDRFVDWLRSMPGALVDLLKQSIPEELHHDVGLDNWSWVELLTEVDVNLGSGWLTRARSAVRGDLAQVSEAINEAIAADQLSRVSPLNRIRTTLASRPLIQTLAQSGVLPKYGFPVDIAYLDLARSGDRRAARLDLSRDLSQAVSMYAPGNKTVAAGALWEPIGLKKPPNGAFIRRWWGKCDNCGALQVRLDLGETEVPACRVCEGTIWKTKGRFVVPLFGFIGAMSREKPGERRPPSVAMSETFFDRYEGTEPTPELLYLGPGSAGQVEARHSRQAWITVIAKSRSAGGFQLCDWCGAISEVPLTNAGRRKQGTHKRPDGKGDCDGNFAFVQFGHRYLTDAVELRLAPEAVRSEHGVESTLHALLAATRSVGITRDDMNGSTRPFISGRDPAIVLFDGVPGGAGHAHFLTKHLAKLFESAYQVVNSCECGADTSCYGCLRTYRNQFVHEELVRGAARDTLARILGYPTEA